MKVKTANYQEKPNIPHIDLITGSIINQKGISNTSYRLPLTCDLLIDNLLSYYGLPGIPDPLPWGFGSYISLIERCVVYWHYIPNLTEYRQGIPLIDIWYSDRLKSQFSDGLKMRCNDVYLTSLYDDYEQVNSKLSQKIKEFTGYDLVTITERYKRYMLSIVDDKF